jgi:hypothetical protein
MDTTPPAPGADLWYWPGWLPAGFLTLLVGPVSSGKSALALHIAGSVITGRPWPDGTPNNVSRGPIVWCDTESSHFLNLDRIRKWDLPPRGFLFPSLFVPESNLDLLRSGHRQAIFAAARNPITRLIIIDSLHSLIRSENTARATEIIAHLGRLAQTSGLPVLATHHLRNPHSSQKHQVTLDRIHGPTATIQYPRLIWAIDTPYPPADPRRLYPVKNNFGPFPPALDFSITTTGLHFHPAPEDAPPPYLSALDRAAVFLVDLLSAGPLPATEVAAAHTQSGYARTTVLRAKRELGVISYRQGGKWFWSLHDPKNILFPNIFRELSPFYPELQDHHQNEQ